MAAAVKVLSGKATHDVQAWGAFTVGAEVVGTSVRLELDLAENARFPKLFRSRF